MQFLINFVARPIFYIMKLLELIKKRYSVRNFLPTPVEQSKLDYLMECVRMSPSAVNLQPWLFAIVTDGKQLEALQKVYPKEWIKSAPCIIVACVNHDVSWHRKADNKDHGDIDVAIATEHLCLAAAEQDLGTCWVCNFDAKACKEIMQLPPQIEPVVLIPLGYPAVYMIPEKKRKSLKEIIL